MITVLLISSRPRYTVFINYRERLPVVRPDDESSGYRLRPLKGAWRACVNLVL